MTNGPTWDDAVGSWNPNPTPPRSWWQRFMDWLRRIF